MRRLEVGKELTFGFGHLAMYPAQGFIEWRAGLYLLVPGRVGERPDERL